MLNFTDMTDEQVTAYRATVASLNDDMRAKITSPAPNIAIMTAGILAEVDSNPALAFAKQIELMAIIANFADFTEDNNPHGERDFGAFDWQGIRCFWKIDCYDKAADGGSPNPADPAVTCRILTILRADEY